MISAATDTDNTAIAHKPIHKALGYIFSLTQRHNIIYTYMTDLTAKWSSRLGAFEELTHKWKVVGLGALQKTTLDADALLITANKESLAQGRRTLGAKTKEFAQLPNDQKLSNFGSLLKCYQSYVDELTKYLTEAERCYFHLHNVVHAMVDPFPLMDRFAKEKNTLLEFVKGFEESENLRRVVKEREEELFGLRNQEVTIKNLRAQLAETELAAMANAERTVSNSQEELNALLNQWKQRESELHQELQRSLSEQRRSEGEIKELGSQLASLRLKYSDLEELRDSETSALASELEEAAIQSKLNQRELDRLRSSEKELQKIIASTTMGGTLTLGSTLEATGIDPNDVNFVTSMSQELQQSKDECNNLRVRCNLLEKELEKSSSGGSAGLLKGNSIVTLSIAQLQDALEKSREEISRLREDVDAKERLIGSLNSRLETAQSDVVAKDAELVVLRAKLKKMEEDKQPLLAAIRDLERELGGRRQGNASAGTDASQPPTSFDLASILKPNAPGSAGHSNVSETEPSHAPSPPQSSDEAFFAVTTQRDRLRQRLLALEEAASQEVEQLRSALKAARDERDELLMQQHSAKDTSAFTLRIPNAGVSDIYSPQVKKRRQVVTALDHLMVLLYKHVLSDVWMRRAFLGYLSALHVFVLVDLFYHTSGFF